VVELWRRIAARAPGAIGNPWTFLFALGITAAYVATGPLFYWSGNWLLILATSSTGRTATPAPYSSSSTS